MTASTGRRAYRGRPWRAIAYVVDPWAPHGRRRQVAGRASAATADGLTRFLNAHRRQGHAVDVLRVTSIEDVAS